MILAPHWSKSLFILYELAKECNHVTEFGTNQLNSTIALLHAQPDKLMCYAPQKPSQFETLRSIAGKTEIVFRQENYLEAEIEPTDLLFTDTTHTYEQVIAEMRLHAKNIKKYIVIHDTELYGQKGERGGKGIWSAVTEFVEGGEFKIKKHLDNNNGLSVIERQL